ncbi:MAG TPA: MBL fold metallo-hydrolase [Bryobacteraceae bacterium]|jgi:glyoxylase-like metal-dependent hydrolase (beta-lactamase superfamily II)
MLTRRHLIRSLAAAPFVAAAQESRVTEIVPGLKLLRRAVNIAVFESKGKALLIDSGDLERFVAEWALYTHHHPDQASGAARLSAVGVKIGVPAAERRFFEDARAVWESADNRLDHDYNCRPDLFTLRDPVPVAAAFKDGDTHVWQDLKFEVLATPGHTDGSLTYLVEAGGKRIAFTGDLIYGPGQIHDFYSLQKAFPGMDGGYWGFGGAVEDVKASLDRVLARKPDLLIPSHGVVIEDPPSAVEKLKRNLDAVMENYLATCAWRANKPGIYTKPTPAMLEPLPPVAYPKWCRDITYTTKALVADDKSVFLSDCGSPRVVEELARLQKSGEIGAIEGLWVTHYHDDHTESINLARRRFDFPVYAQRTLVDILEHPTAYQGPCLYPESVRVDRVLDDRQTFTWKQFKLTAFDFPSQTLYHDGLLVERDGYKVFFTGDGFSSRSFSDVCSQNRNFSGRDAGMEKCCKILLETKPDILLTAHWGPLAMTAEYLEKFIESLQAREKIYQQLFPYDDVNFGLDPYWLRAYPFRQRALPGTTVEIQARAMNHSDSRKRIQVTLNLPRAWQSVHTSGELAIPPHTEGRIRFSAVAPDNTTPRRHALGLSALVDNQPVGEFGVAIVDLLSA